MRTIIEKVERDMKESSKANVIAFAWDRKKPAGTSERAVMAEIRMIFPDAVTMIPKPGELLRIVTDQEWSNDAWETMMDMGVQMVRIKDK